ncbi:MAG: UbiA family prenyltransferase [Candidatus Njordarchaeia archaeon]
MKISKVPRIMRLHNSFMGSLTVAISAYLFTKDWLTIIYGMLTYIFIASSQNIINDIYDVEVDKINRPNRPIPSGAITIKEAYFLFYLFTIIGLTFSAISSITIGNPYPFILAFLMVIIGVLYSWKLKIMGFIGNITVGVSFSMGYIYGILIATNYFYLTSSIITAIMFFLISTTLLIAREIVKGIEDVEGDKLRDVKTLARSKGIKFASITAATFYTMALILFTWIYFVGVLSVYFIPFLVIGDIATILAIYYSLKGFKGASKASFWGKVGAFDGLVGFLIGVI